jgi:DHA2 family multidrug resistance protein
MWLMTRFSLDMTAGPLILSGLIQGVGTGLVFVPLATIAFATLDARYRGDAASVFTLLRNLGSSAGISILEALLTQNVEVSRSDMTPHVTPDNPIFRFFAPSAWNLSTTSGLSAVSGEINRQASMVAYIDDFQLMLVGSIAILPLLLLMSGPKRRPEVDVHAFAD